MLVHLLVGLMLMSSAAPQDKIDGKLIVGKWEPEKKPDGVDKILVEFTKDNKMFLDLETNGEKQKIEGTYKVDGDKLEVKFEVQGQPMEQKRTITKLTETEMITKDDEGTERKYKKAK
jgi:uncharacterized protein (TIGR03066 family)